MDSVWGWAGRKMLAATQRDKTGSWFVEWAQGGRSTVSGENVSNNSALQLSTVFACIRAISEDVAKVPLKVYKHIETGGKEPRPDHILYPMLHDQPNPDMTAMTFRQTLTAHALGWGNGYAEIQRYHDFPMALWPMRPDRVRVMRLDDGRIWYELMQDDGTKRMIPWRDVLHIVGMGFDGLVGYNVIRYARESLGAALAAMKYGSAFFGNSATASGVLTLPGNLSEPAQKRLKAQIEALHRGAENSNRVMVLEEGTGFTQTSIPPEEAQFLETRQFSVPEICRWFRIPPHKVSDLSRATFSNIEHQALEYVGDTLLPWMERWEQEIQRKLIAPGNQSKFFAQHVIEGLLRGDIKTRYSAYQTARNWGWMSADDIRELEDMNPLPDGQGESYLIPLNMKDASEPDAIQLPPEPKPPEPEPEPEDEAEKRKRAKDMALQDALNERTRELHQAKAEVEVKSEQLLAEQQENARLRRELAQEKQANINLQNDVTSLGQENLQVKQDKAAVEQECISWAAQHQEIECAKDQAEEKVIEVSQAKARAEQAEKEALQRLEHEIRKNAQLQLDKTIAHAAECITNKEIREIEKVIGKLDATDKKRDKFNEWIEKHFGAKHADYISTTIAPIGTCEEAIIDLLTQEVVGAFTKGDPQDAMAAWRESRKEQIETAIKGGLSNAATETE